MNEWQKRMLKKRVKEPEFLQEKVKERKKERKKRLIAIAKAELIKGCVLHFDNVNTKDLTREDIIKELGKKAKKAKKE